MARSSFQKLKLLHVMNYLLQNSDEEHPITVNQMIQYLESNGIAAERKSIYDDIEALRTFMSARVRLWLLSRRSLPRYCPVVTIPNGPVWRRRRKSPVGKHW